MLDTGLVYGRFMLSVKTPVGVYLYNTEKPLVSDDAKSATDCQV